MINGIDAITLPNGWLFFANAATFNGASSILANGAGWMTIIQGTGSETQITNPGVITSNISLITPTTSANPPGAAGNYTNPNIYYTGIATVVFTNSVLVSSKNNVVRKVTLSSPTNSPFYSDLGSIKNSAGTVVGVLGLNEIVVGWDDTMFLRYTFPIGTPYPNLTPNTQSVIGTTTLVSIITELLAEKGITATYMPGFDEEVIGFNTRATDIAQDIINLLTVFNKVVFEDIENNLIFAPYPDDSNLIEIPITAHVSEPETTITQKSSLPDAVNFGFRDSSRQYDSNSVKVGGSDNNVTDFSLEITLDPSSAQYRAWVVRNRLRQTYISGTLHLLPSYSFIEANDVCLLKGLTDSDLDLKILITRREQGADLSIRLQFVNWSAPITYQDYQTSSLSFVFNPGILNPSEFKLIDTQPRSNLIGLTSYTESSATITSSGSTIFNPTTNYLRGIVDSISPDGKTVTVTLAKDDMALTSLADYYVGGSWVRFVGVTNTIGNTFELTNFVCGYYGSEDSINVGDYLYQLAEENTFNNNYISYTATRGSSTFTLTPETKKRIHEPLLAQFRVNGGFLTIRRKQKGFTDDLNLGSNTPNPLPKIYLKLVNLTTFGVLVMVLEAGQDSISFAYTVYDPGHIIEVRETTSSFFAIPNVPVNTTIGV